MGRDRAGRGPGWEAWPGLLENGGVAGASELRRKGFCDLPVDDTLLNGNKSSPVLCLENPLGFQNHQVYSI